LTASLSAEVRQGKQARAAAPPSRRAKLEAKLNDWVRRAYIAGSLPIAVLFLFHDRRIHPSYGMTWRKKFRLGWRMYRNTGRIQTGTSYRAHLAMALTLLEIPPSTKGVVVECGCWKGGSTTNLSLVCDIVGRDLIVYDSFEGLPAPRPNDKWAVPSATGFLRGDLDEVRENVRRYGAVERCQFRKGWFSDTLPSHDQPIVLAYLDVDYEASMYDCVVNLWPHVTPKGYVFIDEFTRLDYCAIFFSERFWKEHFDTAPPGLMGAGTGIGIGQYFVGPWRSHGPLQHPTSVAYTRKDFYGLWDYVPSDDPGGADRGTELDAGSGDRPASTDA
jgi:O-methyltransferase